MKLSFVLPVFNEEEKLRDFFVELHNVARQLTEDIQYIFINDGSVDGSLEIMKSLKQEFAAVGEFKIINFSRNFGHQSAVTAGLVHAEGDAVVLMDTDMQDDPSAIPQFIEKWNEGHQVVYAVRSRRQEDFFLRFLFRSYYRFFSKITHINIPNDAGNYGLVDRRIIKEVNDLPEHNRYFPGLRAWVGFKQVGVNVPRRARASGEPKVGMMGLFRLALDGIVSFSNFPLRIAFLISFFLAIIGGISILIVVSIKIFIPEESVPMWASLMSTIIFLGAGQFFLIGLLGEYVGRIYSEVKKRPHYVIEEIF